MIPDTRPDRLPDRLPDPAASDFSFARSAAGLAVLVRFAGARGLPAERALAGTGLSPYDLEEPRREVTAAQELRVVRTLHHALGEVGTDVGRSYTAAAFGTLGWALVSSRTVLDALATALRFIDLSHAFAIPRADLDDDGSSGGGGGGTVSILLVADGLPGDVRRFLLERDASAVHTVLESLVPGGVGATLELLDPPDPRRARIRFAATELDRPLPRGSDAALEAAETLCRAVVDRRRRRTGLAGDVRVLITQRLAEGAPMPDVAAVLGLTERTLRRRLAAEGTGYRELLEEVRRGAAEALTATGRTLPVADLAARLGYADAASYLHARARWRATRRPAGSGHPDAR